MNTRAARGSLGGWRSFVSAGQFDWIEGKPLTAAIHTILVMPKRRFIPEAEADDNRYADAECPECGAIVNARFQRGRNRRRLQCPVCRGHVIVSIQEEETPLIKLAGLAQNQVK